MVRAGGERARGEPRRRGRVQGGVRQRRCSHRSPPFTQAPARAYLPSSAVAVAGNGGGHDRTQQPIPASLRITRPPPHHRPNAVVYLRDAAGRLAGWQRLRNRRPPATPRGRRGGGGGEGGGGGGGGGEGGRGVLRGQRRWRLEPLSGIGDGAPAQRSHSRSGEAHGEDAPTTKGRRRQSQRPLAPAKEHGGDVPRVVAARQRRYRRPLELPTAETTGTAGIGTCAGGTATAAAVQRPLMRDAATGAGGGTPRRGPPSVGGGHTAALGT